MSRCFSSWGWPYYGLMSLQWTFLQEFTQWPVRSCELLLWLYISVGTCVKVRLETTVNAGQTATSNLQDKMWVYVRRVLGLGRGGGMGNCSTWMTHVRRNAYSFIICCLSVFASIDQSLHFVVNEFGVENTWFFCVPPLFLFDTVFFASLFFCLWKFCQSFLCENCIFYHAVCVYTLKIDQKFSEQLNTFSVLICLSRGIIAYHLLIFFLLLTQFNIHCTDSYCASRPKIVAFVIVWRWEERLGYPA